MARLLSVLLLLAASCSTVITPTAVLESELPVEQKLELNARWESGVQLANAFLASDQNDSLPAGWISLLPDEGMYWHHPDGCREIRVENTWWGDRCVGMGFAAQERSWGFVVGDRGDGPQVTHNSLFFYVNQTMKHPADIAELVLHEAAHMIHHEGTVGFFAGLSYYWHAMFHGGGREHPAELLPYTTSDEFHAWFASQVAASSKP